jgi:hypothetical protein
MALAPVASTVAQERAACCPSGHKVYFPDGFDHADGMGAYIDLGSKSMAVADQVFPLSQCKSHTSKICFISEYFTFSSRHYKDVATWFENGYKFTIFAGGRCSQSICKNAPPDTYIISSRQDYKDIEFYYIDKCGLMGWKMTYAQDDGFVDNETYYVPAYIPDKRE